MKVSFDGKPSAPVIDAEVVQGHACAIAPASEIPTCSALAVRPPAAIAVPRSDSVPGYDDDDISFEDIILPALNIVQGIGDLSQIFTPGEIVLNQSLVIHEPANPVRKTVGTPPLSLTVIGFRKRKFVEDVKFGEPCNVFSDEQGVVNAGGTLDFNEAKATGKVLYNRLATGLFLVQKPAHIADEDHLVFSQGCEGKWYSLALWSMKKTGYTGGAKIIYTAKKQGHLREGGYPSFSWNLTTKLKPFGNGNSAHVPVLTPGVRNTPEFLAFVKGVLASGE